MSASTRIYYVTDSASKEPGRLVRATSQAQAIRHVTAERFNAAPASQEDIVNAMTAGVKVEDAGAKQATDAD